jgi:hypothetical protein
MSAIPLHIQRRFDQKWASRFTLRVAPNVPKNVGTKAAASTTGRRAATNKEKPAGLSRRAVSFTC